MSVHLTPNDQETLNTLFSKEMNSDVKKMPEVSHDVRNKVEEITSVEKKEDPVEKNNTSPQPVLYKKPRSSAAIFNQKKASLSAYSSEAKPMDKIGGGLLGAGIGGGAAFGLLQVLSHARYWAWVPDLIAGPLTTVSGFLSPAAPFLIGGAAALGLIWGAKKLWKMWRK